MRPDGPSSNDEPNESAASRRREFRRILLPYVLFSVLWITLSDLLLNAFVSSPRVRTELSIYKGWLFVLATAVLLAILIRAESRRRERIRMARAEYERKYRAIFDSVGEAIFVHSPKGGFVEVNRTAIVMFGYDSEAELLAADVSAISAPGPEFSGERAGSMVAAAINEGPQLFPWRSRRKDGSLFWSEVSLRKVTMDGRDYVLAVVRDVDARRRIQEELRASQERFEILFRESHDYVAIVNNDNGRIIDANANLTRLYDDRRQIVGRPILEAGIWNSEADRRAFLDALSAGGGRLESFPALMNLGTAGPRDCLISARILSIDGRPSIFTRAHDVTVEKRTEAELVRNKAWLERAEHIGRLGAWTVDLRTGRVWASPEALHIYGLPAGELSYAEVKDAVLPAHRALMDAKWAGLVERGEPYDVEFQIRRKSNGAVVDIHSAAELDPASSLVFGIIRDITEEKRTQARVRQQAALLDIANDAIYVRTLDGAITFWNKGAERLYGWTAQEVAGHPTSDFFAGNEKQADATQAALLAEGSWTGERTHATKDGREVTVLARLTLLRDDSGTPQAVLAINTDITEQKRLEAKFLRAQRLESLGALASGIAHDLNNVLAPILLSIPLLKAEIVSSDTLSVLETIEASARRGADVVRQVLTFARGLPGERTSVPVGAVLAEIVKMARETFPRNIAISLSEPPKLWPVTGDPTQVHQAIMNLMVNSRDAMPRGGSLTLGAENLGVAEMRAREPDEPAGPRVCIRVSDTGVGIPARSVDKIFEPFYTTKPPGQGTGLGLSTVLGIVRSHGGFLRVRSREGSGTTMEIYLPAAVASPGAPDPGSAAAPATGTGEQLLLVDDENAVREMLKRVLERNGYRVLAAVDGAEAVRLFVQNRARIAAVISDMMMPGMDGPSLVNIIRQFDRSMPIIGISGIGDRAAMDAVNSSGLSAFLIKPFGNERLLEAVSTALAARRSAGA